jgi:selenide,water dikinase
MVDDPYTFGKIAATNALSDIYAMGGEVKTALNIVCFPESMDLNILGEIMRGGSEKVIEAGGVLAGGHSIADTDVKYGLSVTGVVNPSKIYRNNGGRAGDVLILTKKLGVGIVCTANRVGEASESAMAEAIDSMTTLNKYAAEVCREFDIHACTDVTGFSFLGHLHEMMDGKLSCEIYADRVPYIKEAEDYANEFLLTAAAQRNRNFVSEYVHFENVSFAMEEILFDPQTSGGLLIAVSEDESEAVLDRLKALNLPARAVGRISDKADAEIFVKG